MKYQRDLSWRDNLQSSLGYRRRKPWAEPVLRMKRHKRNGLGGSGTRWGLPSGGERMRSHSRGNAAHGRSTRRGRTGNGAKVRGSPSLGFSHGCGTRCGGPQERSRVAAAFASSPLDDDRGEDGERRPGQRESDRTRGRDCLCGRLGGADCRRAAGTAPVMQCLGIGKEIEIKEGSLRNVDNTFQISKTK